MYLFVIEVHRFSTCFFFPFLQHSYQGRTMEKRTRYLEDMVRTRYWGHFFFSAFQNGCFFRITENVKQYRLHINPVKTGQYFESKQQCSLSWSIILQYNKFRQFFLEKVQHFQKSCTFIFIAVIVLVEKYELLHPFRQGEVMFPQGRGIHIFFPPQ